MENGVDILVSVCYYEATRNPTTHRKEAKMADRKTTTSAAVKDRWKAANYTRVTIYLPKKDAEEYKDKCVKENLSLSDVPKDAIYKFLRGE